MNLHTSLSLTQMVLKTLVTLCYSIEMTTNLMCLPHSQQ